MTKTTFERFTDRSRKVLQLANQEAMRFNHSAIDTAHILLGLIKEGTGVAAHVLKNLGLDLRRIRLAIENIVQMGPEPPAIHRLPRTPEAEQVLQYAIEEAKNLNHAYVGTEHLLLGLLRVKEGVAAQALTNLNLKLEDVYDEVFCLLGIKKESAITTAPLVLYGIRFPKESNPEFQELEALLKKILDLPSNIQIGRIIVEME